MEEGFLSFVRLIGTVYFKKHLAEFTLDTPRALYMSLAQDGIGPVQQHKRFIEVIRESLWSTYMYSPDTDVYHIGLNVIAPSVHDVYICSTQ